MGKKNKPSQEYPNITYPQNKLPGNTKPSNPIITGPTLDDQQPHYYDHEIKHPQPPHIPTDDANGFRPSLPPDQKPKPERSNSLAVDRVPQRRRRLKSLSLNRVDLVTAGANPGAYVMIHKFEDEVEKREFSTDERKRHAASGKAMPGGQYPIVNVSDLKNAIQSVGRAKNRAAVVSHIKSRAAALGRTDLIPDTFKSMEKGAEMADETEGLEVLEKVEKVESPQPKRVKAISKAQESLLKALESEVEVRKQLEERLAKMEDERNEAEFIAKARDLGNLGNPTDLGRLMRDVHKGVPTESYQALERLLKAANAQMEKGDLFATLGRSETEPESVEDRINVLAKAKLAAGAAKTIELAKMEVLHENPDLRNEYLNARRS